MNILFFVLGVIALFASLMCSMIVLDCLVTQSRRELNPEEYESYAKKVTAWCFSVTVLVVCIVASLLP